MMKDIEHLLRVAAAFIAAIAIFLFARAYLTPPSFGAIGHYRADSVDEIKALPLHYAGQKECSKCHKDQARDKALAGHRTINCESCHGPAAEHIKAPAKAKLDKPAEKDMREFCGVCHSKNISRPKGFKQQNLYEHNPGMACTQCHNPHKPKL